MFALARFGEKLDLDGPRRLDAALGGVSRAARAVIIAGTNGKGSTAAFLEALLRAAGIRTGLFTSPHLVSFRERIRVDGADVAEAVVVEHLPAVFEAATRVGYAPSFFEATWALAARIFATSGVDIAIWEVGLGGRLDATNVAEPEVAAVVSIGLDHTAVLGPDLDHIAREKAAVFRPGRPALTAATGEGLAALRRAANGIDLRVIEPSPEVPSQLPLPGDHQRRNAALALAIGRALGVGVEPEALATVRWPGRAEHFGDVVLDCAHNADAAAALAHWWQGRGEGRAHLVVGATEGKDLAAVARALAPMAGTVTATSMSYPRGLPAQVVAAAWPMPVETSPDVATALARRPTGCRTIVTGSCFLVGEARAHLLGLEFPERGLVTTAR